MKGLEEQLKELVTQACTHPAGSAQRQKYLTQIIRLVTNKLWRDTTAYYQDALQQTWVYFCQNICEGNTGEPYNPTRGSIITWLNFYLKRRLQDFYTSTQRQQARTVTASLSALSELAQPSTPLKIWLPKLTFPLLDEVKRWVETDPAGELRRIHITNHPEVTAQALILRRLPPETSWKTLAAELNLSISTLSSFYQRQCLPRLRKFGESEGYL